MNIEPKSVKSIVNEEIKVEYELPDEEVHKLHQLANRKLVLRKNNSEFQTPLKSHFVYDITLKPFKPAFTRQRSIRSLFASKLDRVHIKVTQTPPMILKKRLH